MTPQEILQAELDKYKKALEKLEDAFKLDLIPESIYNERKANLIPKISTFKYAINVLISYM
jgi:hypothetical protein